MTDDEQVLLKAEFNPSVTTYWLLNGVIVCIISIFGILILPIWIIVGNIITKKYLDSHDCVLTDRTLKFKKGILTLVEKTIPLDRITDLGTVQGPVMRMFGIDAMSIETAGQSAGGALLQIAGVKDSQAFRETVLRQRDRVVGSAETVSQPQAGAAVESDQTTKLLTEIRDTLVRIEQQK